MQFLVLIAHSFRLNLKASELQDLRPHTRPTESAFAQKVPGISVHSTVTRATLECNSEPENLVTTQGG